MVSLIVALIIIGVLLYVVNTVIPMDPKIKQILNIVVILCVLVWLLSVFGVIGPVRDLKLR